MAEPTASTFAAAVAPTAFSGQRATAVIPPGWEQGRATFGGVVLGQALAAARRTLPEPRPCLAIVAGFPAPVGAGEVELRLRPLRHGRAVSSVHVELRQGDDVGCVALNGGLDRVLRNRVAQTDQAFAFNVFVHGIHARYPTDRATVAPLFV